MSLEVIKISDQDKKMLDVKINSALVNFIVNWQLAKRRSGTHSVKTMSTVHGTNRKPHSQKGGGRARQGSRKAPHMRHGAVAMGPQPRDYSYKVNKKVKKLALKMILADRFNNDSLIMLKEFPNVESTKNAIENINPLNLTKPLFIVNDQHQTFAKSLRNIRDLNVLHSNGLNVYSIIKHENIIVDQSSWKDIMKRLEDSNAS